MHLDIYIFIQQDKVFCALTVSLCIIWTMSTNKHHKCFGSSTLKNNKLKGCWGLLRDSWVTAERQTHGRSERQTGWLPEQLVGAKKTTTFWNLFCCTVSFISHKIHQLLKIPHNYFYPARDICSFNRNIDNKLTAYSFDKGGDHRKALAQNLMFKYCKPFNKKLVITEKLPW